MKKIKIFLASSNELNAERTGLEIEIYRKCKLWFDKGLFLHLDIWEDMPAQMSLTGSQSEYDKYVRQADLFILLAYTKVGKYTEEEFEHAFGQFKSVKKPFIFTFFKTPPGNAHESLTNFKQKLSELGHFKSDFTDLNDLWNQLNKQLDFLEQDAFDVFKQPEDRPLTTVPTTTNQTADKIYNIDKIDKANFS